MDDHITSEWTDSKFFTLRADVCAEPLRRSDLMNSINKLVSERRQARRTNRKYQDYIGSSKEWLTYMNPDLPPEF